MKYIQLTQGQQTMVDDDLYEWLNQWKWYYRKRMDKRKGGDAVRTLHGYDENGRNKARTVYMAAMILPVPDGFVIDHADVNSLNNQRSNLRKATNRKNLLNSKVRQNNKVGIKGVYWHEAKQRYVVQLSIEGKKKWIGDFKELANAAEASELAIKKYHGDFGRFK